MGTPEFDGITDDQLREIGRLAVGVALPSRMSAYESAKAVLAALGIPFGVLSERQWLVMQEGADDVFNARLTLSTLAQPNTESAE